MNTQCGILSSFVAMAIVRSLGWGREEAEGFLAELRTSTSDAREALDRLKENMDVREQVMSEREADARRKAMVEFEEVDFVALADCLQLEPERSKQQR